MFIKNRRIHFFRLSHYTESVRSHIRTASLPPYLMIIHKRKFSRAIVTMALPLILSGCAGKPVALDSPEHQSLIAHDRGVAEQNKIVEMSLSEALERGIAYNLDARVAAMEVLSQDSSVTVEQLEALPGLTYSRSYIQRSNNGASSSRSVLSGLQSLEPSQSSDRQRQVQELQTTWNLLDAALALSEAQTAKDNTKIAAERYIKVVQNIERDIYAAYWRALVYQETRSATEELLTRGSRQVDNLNIATDEKLMSVDSAGDKISMISERQRNLRDLNNSLSLSETELKGLLSIPQSARLALKKPSTSEIKNYQSLLNQDVASQEWQALKSRPEMREEILQKNVALRDVKEEVIRTFPGGELFFSYNTDTNSFLYDSDWTMFTAKLVQNVLNIFTLPARYEAAQRKEAVADARRQALSAAVLAQVHIARTRLDNNVAAYNDAQKISKTMLRRAEALKLKSSSGFTSGGDAVLARLDGQISAIRAQMAYADVQDSAAALINTLGQRVSNDVTIASAVKR